MKSKLFQFYPPKKEKNPVLLPDSNLLGDSNLIPLSKNAKKRKFRGSKNKNPAFGPVNAPAMSSGLAIIPGPSPSGYGNSAYGALPYGESEEKHKPVLIENNKKTTSSKNYTVYTQYKNLFEDALKY